MKTTISSTHRKKLRMRTALQTQLVFTLVALGCAMLGLTATSLSAQTELLAIEFSQDDQEGFELWPERLNTLSTSTASFPTDPSATSGSITLALTSSTTFGLPANRGGSMDGTPAGYSYQHLYEDLLIARSPTGFLTLDFSGLNPNQTYRFTLYAWDPGDNGGTSAPVKEWTVTGGTGDPSVATVDFRNRLLDNETFAMVFDITTTETGTFQFINTDGLPQSAINGFKLAHLASAEPFNLTVRSLCFA